MTPIRRSPHAPTLSVSLRASTSSFLGRQTTHKTLEGLDSQGNILPTRFQVRGEDPEG